MCNRLLLLFMCDGRKKNNNSKLDTVKSPVEGGSNVRKHCSLHSICNDVVFYLKTFAYVGINYVIGHTKTTRYVYVNYLPIFFLLNVTSCWTVPPVYNKH